MPLALITADHYGIKLQNTVLYDAVHCAMIYHLFSSMKTQSRAGTPEPEKYTSEPQTLWPTWSELDPFLRRHREGRYMSLYVH